MHRDDPWRAEKCGKRSLIAQLLTRPRQKLKELAEHREGVSPLMEPLVEEWETALGPLWQRDAEQREPE